ncbi:MAG: GLUG motif-containing protein, partial [Prevotella sp.]
GSLNGTPSIQWNPIWGYEGIFDGKGYTISGLYYKTTDKDGDSYGLFGSIGSNAEIRDLGIVDSYFDGINSVGGVCGSNNGTIKNCYNTGVVSGKHDQIGGVCGYNNGTIKNCYNSGKVICEQDYAGGVCGANFGTIESCYNTGAGKCSYSIGGVCGSNVGTIKNCYYLSGTATGGINGADVAGSAEGKSADKFNSGEICYLLNGSSPDGAWGQQIGTDGIPVPGSDKTVYEVNLLCGGVHAVGKTYANSNEDVTIAHKLPEAANFNAEKNIYDKVCQREGCGETFYYANAAGTIEATPYDDATEFTVANYPLQDATTYDNKAVFTATNFIYTRTFSNANWTTWYVPFDLTLTQDICAHYDFSRINNVHQYDDDGDGNADRTVVESFRQMPGVTLKANYPYLVKPVWEGDLNMVLPLKGVQPALAETNSIDCQSVDFSYTFTGTYTGMGEVGSSYYDPYTICEDNKWMHFASLNPMRHYLTIHSRNASSPSPASMRSIMLSVVGDEDTTGIVKLYDEERKASETYDISGRRLPAGSQRGLVIENGKVVFKK